MSEQFSIINLDALLNARLNDAPFPYMIINDFLRAEFANSIQNDFPVLKSRGSYPVQGLKYGNTFQRLVDELQSPVLKATIAKRFQIDGIGACGSSRGEHRQSHENLRQPHRFPR